METAIADKTAAQRASFSLRRAEEGDRDTIVAVLAELMPHDDVAERYRWMYQDNPYGHALSWLAFDSASGACAGLGSLFPRRIWAGGQVLLGVLAGDAFVRPAFRRRGIARSLYEHVRDLMPELDIGVMFSTTLAANMGPMSRAGARILTKTVRYVRPMSLRTFGLPVPWADRMLHGLFEPRASTLELDPVIEGDRRVDEAWALARDEIRIATVRDAQFYTWRFLRSPERRQKPFVIKKGSEVVGVCALDTSGNNLRIVDLIVPDQYWLEALATLMTRAKGNAGLELKLGTHHPRARALWRSGFVPRGGTRPVSVYVPKGMPHAELLYDRSAWYFTLGEADIET